VTKLLIGECLSSELALMARERGHHEASHVVWIGKSGWKDWEWKRFLLAEDWLLVTRNSDDLSIRRTEAILLTAKALWVADPRMWTGTSLE
jgi:hypothetical protein